MACFFPYYLHGTALCFSKTDAHLPARSLPSFHFIPDCEFHREVGQVFYANLTPSIIFSYYNSSKMWYYFHFIIRIIWKPLKENKTFKFIFSKPSVYSVPHISSSIFLAPELHFLLILTWLHLFLLFYVMFAYIIYFTINCMFNDIYLFK